jgi:hypothetical protein
VKNATLVLAAQLRWLAGGAGGGLSVLNAACALLLAERRNVPPDGQVRLLRLLAASALQGDARWTPVLGCGA